LELHPLSTSFLEEPPGIPDRLLPTYLIGEKRHVPDHQSTLATARNRSRVVDDLFHRNRQGIRLPLKNASYRVTDQEDIDAGFVQNPRKGIIVSGETGDLLPQALFFDDMRYGDLLSHCFTLQKQKSLPNEPEGQQWRASGEPRPATQVLPIGIRLRPGYLDPSGI